MGTSELRQRRRGKPSEASVNVMAPKQVDPKKIVDPSPSSASSSVQTREYLLLYIGIAILRLSLTHFFLHSYFDPDEFWQTMEPAYCSVFASEDRPFACQGRTWEWMLREPFVSTSSDSSSSSSSLLHQSIFAVGPARTYLNVIPTILFYHLLRFLHWDTHFWVARGPLFLQVLLVAVPIDLLTYALAQRIYPDDKSNIARYALFASLTSWFHAYTTARTLANAYETLLLLLALYLVAPHLFGSSKVATPSTRHAAMAFFLGGGSVAIRNTAVLSFVPLGVLLALRRQRPGGVAAFLQYLLYPCAVYGALGLVCSAAIDRLYFGYWSLPVLANLYFNVVLNNAALYGAHPGPWYWLAGLPTLSGLLFPFLLYAAVQDLSQWWMPHWLGKGSGEPPPRALFLRRRPIWILLLLYVGLLSGNRHKEFRYLLPVLPLICLLTAPHLAAGTRRGVRGTLWAALWIGTNLGALAYLGLFHQSGPVTVDSAIVSLASAATTQSVASVHYLTGACHSTPLQSHLHHPRVQFDTWHLDCSPQCRMALASGASEEEGCETHQFVRDPLQFIQRSYMGDCDAPSCRRSPPDYLVTLSEYMTPEVTNVLTQAPFFLHVLSPRFPFHLRGVRVHVGGSTYQWGAGWDDGVNDSMYGYQSLLGGRVHVNWHAVLLLARFEDAADEANMAPVGP